MFRTICRASLGLAALLTASVAISACGGEESGTSRTRNAVAELLSCAEGGECAVGDTGPGGGTVFYVGETEKPWGRYLEAAPVKWTKKSPEDDPRARFSPGFPNVQKGLSPENLGPGLGRHAWGKVSDYRCGDCISDLIATYNQGAVTDWYLPNADEMQILINSKTRRTNRYQYWTATGVYTQDVTPRMVMLQYTPKTEKWGRTGFWHQYMSYSIVPIRAFGVSVKETKQQPEVTEQAPTTSLQSTETTQTTAASIATVTDETTSSTQPSVLQPPTNLSVSFQDSKIEIKFDLQTEGLAPEGHFVMMKWTDGTNSLKLNAHESSASTWFPQWERGKSVRVLVQSYTNATTPTQISETSERTFEVPMEEPTKQPQPQSDEDIVKTIGVLNVPVLNLPPEEVEGDIDPQNIVNTITSQLPEIDIAKIEVVANNPKSDDPKIFVEISQSEKTPYVIPSDATEVTVRITGTKGEVVEQTKLIARIAESGFEIAPADTGTTVPTTSLEPSGTMPPSTTIKNEAKTTSTTEGTTVETTVVPDEATETSDVASEGEASGANPIVWLLIAILALLLAGFAAQRMKKKS